VNTCKIVYCLYLTFVLTNKKLEHKIILVNFVLFRIKKKKVEISLCLLTVRVYGNSISLYLPDIIST